MIKSCVVVFPIYKPLSPIELLFLENGMRLTHNYTQIIVAPKHLKIDASYGLLKQLPIKYFDNCFFESISGYNHLMLSKDFYSNFIDFEYLLIHQADVYLFKDELADWCASNYDYVGAPWLKPAIINKGKLYMAIHKYLWQPIIALKRKNGWLYNRVGNGGLSLRKVSTAIEILTKSPTELLKKYLESTSPHYHEDVFWAVEAKKIITSFRIPHWKKAISFAFELFPSDAYQLNKMQLPFGCHAPLKNNPEFWKKFIPIIK